MNTKTLEITFTDALQKNFKLTLPNIQTSVTKEMVETQAQNLVSLGLLKTNNGRIQQAASAHLIDKSIVVLF
ncbi:DUF2922 domain-containing protein [Staphylococcus lutrae]|uniref:DUF2922 domain-containing protein n=1 Tax=Staphylococcus lutrae TaxID=155085 RepID=A0AAC9RSX7_9STAP|nr:DUF2922 domain-containing protein [Staphylococcus lutrae]ARJ51169.1 hypothetical protein B5P37_07545 [Staphylococcus lutrae]PNZ39413.1 DUF2922 domain-containing protein [Staphylococcus lutrae]